MIGLSAAAVAVSFLLSGCIQDISQTLPTTTEAVEVLATQDTTTSVTTVATTAKKTTRTTTASTTVPET
ncbi:MAG: hypothetical protein J6X60_07680, partial [Ruminiclostridium sp.]|nr:hypothetical protein [Ruminiclostridium sp.]